ncbi:MAG: TlpA family protein disulfide reductase [Bacteroidales bacterium]|jgi:peroxiredoxin|nr:TlpA family protein disulfide reductase [Bacteroidales bacterium]
MRTLLFLFCFFLFCDGSILAQTKSNYPLKEWLGEGEFIIAGKVLNKPTDMKSWQLAVTGYLSNEGFEIPVKEDGSFEKAIPVTDVQDIYLYLGNDAITIFSFPGDKIQVSFDGHRQIETLEIKGTTEARNKELDLCLRIYRNFRKDFLKNSGLAYDRQKSPKEKSDQLNEYYDKKINLIRTFETEKGTFPFLRKFQDGAYFEVARIAAGIDGILPEIHCDYPRMSLTSITTNGNTTDTIKNSVPNYQLLDYRTFRTVPEYRDFLENYLRNQSKKTFSWSIGYPEQDDSNYINRYTSLSERYIFGKESLEPVPPIRDWYLSSMIHSALTYQPLKDVDSLYHDFLNICESKEYLSILTPKYQQALLLAPGQPAPDFELKNVDGKMVRLSDFRGKIVYMDFWGRGCGPCIYEFQNSKEEFQQKYGTGDIVFIYVCVDSKEPQWRQAVEQYQLKGVNLIAEGWTKHPACKAYNVEGIPHYVLIDKEGKIVNNKCDRPSSMLYQGENSELEKLLSQYK